MEEFHQKTGVSKLLTVVFIILGIGVGAAAAWYYMDSNAKSAKKTSDDRIATLQKDLDKSGTDLKAAQTVANISETDTAPAPAHRSNEVTISYSADHKTATIANNGVKSGEIALGNDYYYVTIIKQTANNAYLDLRPDGLGGFILYAYCFPAYKLNLAANTLAKISDCVNDVSDSEKYVIGTKSQSHTIYLRDMSTNTERTFNIDSKYAQFGDALISPNDKKIAFAAAVGDPDNVRGDVFSLDIASGQITKVNSDQINSDPHITNWSTNETFGWR